MALRADGLARILLPVLGLAYPFAVYFLLGRVPLWAFLALGLIAGGGRLFCVRHRVRLLRYAVPGFVLAGLALAGLFSVNALGAVQFYPVMVSLLFAGLFGFSLRYPPTIIEKIARLTNPDLPPQGVRYTRRVTWVWFVFLLFNAMVAAALILWGTLAQWTLWCGLLSYLTMGLLFVGEYLVRKLVVRV